MLPKCNEHTSFHQSACFFSPIAAQNPAPQQSCLCAGQSRMSRPTQQAGLLAQAPLHGLFCSLALYTNTTNHRQEGPAVGFHVLVHLALWQPPVAISRADLPDRNFAQRGPPSKSNGQALPADQIFDVHHSFRRHVTDSLWGPAKQIGPSIVG